MHCAKDAFPHAQYAFYLHAINGEPVNSSHGQLVTPKNRVTSWPYGLTALWRVDRQAVNSSRGQLVTQKIRVSWPYCFTELRTLWTQDTSDPGHFGTSLVGPNCPDRSALVPKSPEDSSDLSTELSCPKCRTVPSQVPRSLGPFLTTTVCSMIKKRHLLSLCIRAHQLLRWATV